MDDDQRRLRLRCAAFGLLGPPGLAAFRPLRPLALTAAGLLGPLRLAAFRPLRPLGLTAAGLLGPFRLAAFRPLGLTAAGLLGPLRLAAFRPLRPLGLTAAGLLGPFRLAAFRPLWPFGLTLLGGRHRNAGDKQRITAHRLVSVIDLDLSGRAFLRRSCIRRIQGVASRGYAGKRAVSVNDQPHRLRKSILRHHQPVNKAFSVLAGSAVRLLLLAVQHIVQRHSGQLRRVLRQRGQRQRQLAQHHQHAEHPGSRPFDSAIAFDHV